MLILILATVKIHQNFLKMPRVDFTAVDRMAERNLRDMGMGKWRLHRVEMISSLTSSEERCIVVYRQAVGYILFGEAPLSDFLLHIQRFVCLFI